MKSGEKSQVSGGIYWICQENHTPQDHPNDSLFAKNLELMGMPLCCHTTLNRVILMLVAICWPGIKLKQSKVLSWLPGVFFTNKWDGNYIM